MFLVTGKATKVGVTKNGNKPCFEINMNLKYKKADGTWADNWHNYKVVLKDYENSYQVQEGDCVTIIGDFIAANGTLYPNGFSINRGETINVSSFVMDLYVWKAEPKVIGNGQALELLLNQKNKKDKDGNFEKREAIKVLLWSKKAIEESQSSYPERSTVTVSGSLKLDNKKKEDGSWITYWSMTNPQLWKGVAAANDGIPGETKRQKYTPREKAPVAAEEELPAFNANDFARENTMMDDGDLPF